MVLLDLEVEFHGKGPKAAIRAAQLQRWFRRDDGRPDGVSGTETGAKPAGRDPAWPTQAYSSVQGESWRTCRAASG